MTEKLQVLFVVQCITTQKYTKINLFDFQTVAAQLFIMRHLSRNKANLKLILRP